MAKPRDRIIIYTDGACSGNPGPGGWGAVILTLDDYVRELGGRDVSTTNNRMELTAVIEALEFCKSFKNPVTILTDSTYVIYGVQGWVKGWQRNGWKTSEGKPVNNKDLWEKLVDLVYIQFKIKSVEFQYVRGHTGIEGNERCDQIAVAASQSSSFVALYDGDFKNYPYQIYPLPPNEGVPKLKSFNNKKEAPFSYLSLLGGVIIRHKTWAQCERRVKGQSGARFKKALTQDDEREILKLWGHLNDRIIDDQD